MRALRRISARRIYECRFRLLALFELGQELAQEFVVEAGADLAGIAKLAVVVITKQKCAETFARTLRIGEPADDHLLPLRAFDLHPLARTRSARVARVRFLADGALEAKLAGLLEKRIAAALHLGTDPDGAHALADDFAQQQLALA